MNIYKLIFDKTSFELMGEYDSISEHDKEHIDTLNTESYFDFDDGHSYYCYLIMQKMEMESYINILNRNDIKYEYFDISERLLKHEIDIYELEKFVKEDTKVLFEFFVDDVNDWIFNNLNIDHILDRILVVGNTDKLSNVEREFLENYNK